MAEKEKMRAATNSVLAAVFLTLMKIVVGVATNSIGILSEAAHSGLDLVAAAVTYFAVRISDTPPDTKHPYGHGKVENLSALIETVLLMATCVWIVYEACHRIFISNEHVEASIWSFIVMGISIIVDFTRSRMLLKMAKKHNSQALEADALHFSTDIWSSCVVIIGLSAIVVAEQLPHASVWRDWLFKADAFAALCVAAIVMYVSMHMGRKSIDALLDAVPVEITTNVRLSVESLPGVLCLQNLRIRQSGPAVFVDMVLQIPRLASLEEAHSIADEAEKRVRDTLPNADTMVHIEPVSINNESIIENIRSIAAKKGLGVHGIRVHQVRQTLYLEMHVEVSEDLNLKDAHEYVTSFEQELYASLPNVTSVATHIEPIGDGAALRLSQPIDAVAIVREVQDICDASPDVEDCHNIKILGDGERPSISFHCRMKPETSMIYAHKVTVALEATLHLKIPGIDRIIIHLEPMD
jgi:cation diffusion facilitator family transporter